MGNNKENRRKNRIVEMSFEPNPEPTSPEEFANFLKDVQNAKPLDERNKNRPPIKPNQPSDFPPQK